MKKYKLNLKSKIKHRLYEFGMVFMSIVFNNRKGVKVIIFGQGRSGSTLLENLIMSTGYFTEQGELLNNKKTEKWFPYHFINGLRSINKDENFIFHLKIYHLTTERKKEKSPEKFISKAVKDGWKIIYLHRDNKVKQAISNLVAEKRGRFHKLNQDKESVKVTVDLDRFERMVEHRFEYTKQEIKILKGISHFKIVYEEDLLDNTKHTGVVSNLLDYLNLENKGSSVSTTYKKVNNTELEDLLTNYDEFIEFLKRKNWLHYIQ